MSTNLEHRPPDQQPEPWYDGPRPRRGRPSPGARRFGYLVAVGVNLLLFYLINQSPGWQAVPFLTADVEQVLGLVNASLVAGVIANAVYVLADPRWLRALGDIVTTSIGVAAMVRLWQVWPFDFGTSTVDWDLVARVVVAVGIVGGAIGILAAVVSFVQACLRR